MLKSWLLDALVQPVTDTREELQRRLLDDYIVRRDAELADRYQACSSPISERVQRMRKVRSWCVTNGQAMGLGRISAPTASTTSRAAPAGWSTRSPSPAAACKRHRSLTTHQGAVTNRGQ
jgi:hypothetical protein